MTLEEMRARLAEIRSLLETDENANVDELDKEARGLMENIARIEKRTRLVSDIADGRKGTAIENRALNAFAAGGTGRDSVKEFDKRTVLATAEYRSAWAKSLMRRPESEFTADETRALGVALTTTDTTYSAATADADGVNNGGLFIPEGVMLDLLERIEQVSPIFRDLNIYQIRGELKFPYIKDRGGLGARDEDTPNPDASREFAELTLSTGELSETLPVSWRLEAMAVDNFIEYVTGEMFDALNEEAVSQFIYGTGTDNEVKGLTYTGFIDGEYDPDEVTPMEAIKIGLGLLDKKRKIGAKIYISTDIAEAIAFERDQNGRYMRDPVNSAGINSITKYPVEVDPYLEEGDFIIANLRKGYKANIVEPFSLTKDRIGKKRRNEYTTFGVIGGAPVPGAILYGYKEAEEDAGDD